MESVSFATTRSGRWALAVWIAMTFLCPAISVGQQGGTVLWEFSTGGKVLAAPALGHDGTAYVSSQSGRLHALDSLGREKWQFTLGGYDQWAPPVVGRDRTIYVAAFGLYAVSPLGQELWRVGGLYPRALAASANGTMYLSSDGNVQALAADGSRKWTFASQGSRDAAPVIAADGTVYGVTDTPVPDEEMPGKFITISVLSGFDPHGTTVRRSGQWDIWPRLRWSSQGWAAMTGDGMIITPSESFRPSGPDLAGVYMGKWRQQSASYNPPPCSTVIGNSGVIYFATCDEYVYFGVRLDPYFDTTYFHAVNPDGSLKWELYVAGGVLGAAVDAQENIYFGTGAGKFCALDGEGNTLWQLDLGSAVGIPTLGPDGVIYVGTAAGKVFAIKVAAGPGASPWPQFQRNAQHTGSMESYLTVNQARQLSLAGIPTRTYRIEFSESLVAPQWRAVTNVTLATDTQPLPGLLPANSAGGFYRAVLEP